MSYYLNAAKKAWAVTIFMGFCGAASLWFNVQDWKNATPLIIFYAVIAINTFFSVRCFSSIIPPDNKLQWAIDICLLLSYILMALNMDNPLMFAFWAAILFSIAVLKYAALLSLTNYFTLLKYKVIIDSLGTLSCVLALGGIIFGYTLLAIWIWTIAFILANGFIFFIKPLYELPK
jgi:hypothetical protein